jgi:hypothetical protein
MRKQTVILDEGYETKKFHSPLNIGLSLQIVGEVFKFNLRIVF